MKLMLKPPGTKRLKLEYDGLLSNFGFKFSLRRYIKDVSDGEHPVSLPLSYKEMRRMCGIPKPAKLLEEAKAEAEGRGIEFAAGAYTRPLSTST
jgi:hypothetical protein